MCCSFTDALALSYMSPSVRERRSHTPFLNLQVTYHQLLFDKVRQESSEESNSLIKCLPPGS